LSKTLVQDERITPEASAVKRQLPGSPGLADPVQEGQRALHDKLGCLLVAILHTRVGEQMARTGVEEQLRILDLLDQRLGRGAILFALEVGQELEEGTPGQRPN
jgi:hypothetical protein